MIDQETIKRYLKGEADEADLRKLKAYLLAKDPSLLKEWMAKDWVIFSSQNDELPEKLSSEMLQQVKKEIAGAKIIRLKERKKARRRWVAAAAILLAISIGLGFWLTSPEPMEVYLTEFGEWKTISLPDGSTIQLNANSEIRYQRSWKEGNDRKVWLKGEAFFKVEKKPATGAKFRVITDDLQVEVLGTSFNVNSRQTQTDVFLEEGAIKLKIGDQEEVLEPGDFIAYSSEKKKIVERKDHTPAELHTSWKDGVLILKDKSVAEILKKIEAIYGVRTKVEKEALLQEKKTISVPMDRLEITIPVLEMTFGTKILQQQDQLIIQ